MSAKNSKKLSLDAFKAKSESEKIDLSNLTGGTIATTSLLAACHDPVVKESGTCLFPSNYNSCRCC